MKKILFFLLQTTAALSLQAQFSGGDGRGDARQANDAISLGGEDLNVLFSGGSGNGQTRSITLLSALPITLLHFEGRAEGAAAQLSWTAISDPGEDFEVQRATVPGQWQRLSRVSGTGDGQAIKTYSYRDAAPAAGVQYYRLALLNHTGGVQYSGTVRVAFVNTGVQVLPTVTTGMVQLDLPAGNGTVALSIRNAGGQVLEQRTLSRGRQQLSLSHLSAGVYLLQFGSGEKIRVVKL